MKKICATSNIKESPYRSRSCFNHFLAKPPAASRSSTKNQPVHWKKLSWVVKEPFLAMKRPLFAKRQKSIISLKKAYTNIFRNTNSTFISQKARTKRYYNKTIGNYTDLSKLMYPNNVTGEACSRRERSPQLPERVKRRRELHIKLAKPKKTEQDQPLLSFRNSKGILSEDKESNGQHKNVKEVSEGIFFMPNKTKYLPFLSEKEVDEALDGAEVKTPCFMKINAAEDLDNKSEKK